MKFTAVYSTLSDDNNCYIQTFDIGIYQENIPSLQQTHKTSWKKKPIQPTTKPFNSFYQDCELNMDSRFYDNLICFEMIQSPNVLYLLQFGLHTVQLWRLPTSQSEHSEAHLLYIRAYKGQSYEFSDALCIVSSPFGMHKVIGIHNNIYWPLP
jgi:hypothetical protein